MTVNKHTLDKKNKQSFWQLGTEFYQPVQTKPLKQSFVIHSNQRLLKKLSLKLNADLSAILSGQKQWHGYPSIAQIYAGHQFGHFVSQLGDGRSCLIGEKNGYEISLKGAGDTPYSRMGDGRAVLRSSIREYLCSEAMFALKIPTSEALALVASKETVIREQVETGAIVSRVMPTHIRFGHFQLFASRGQKKQIKQLADFVISNYFTNITKNDYVAFFDQVIKRTAKMIAAWQAYGFTHSVMNTDNMSILGLTIDYGPFGFVEHYQPNFVCNHTDQTRLYAFDQQPTIGLWNLTRLAESLIDLIDVATLKDLLARYQSYLSHQYSHLMRAKLGLKIAHKNDNVLLTQWLDLLENNQLDFTNAFRQLSHYDGNQQSFAKIYQPFLNAYDQRLSLEKHSNDKRQAQMCAVNPKYILRNYQLDAVIEKAKENDFTAFNALFDVISQPFAEHPNHEKLTQAVPAQLKNKQLSCSS